MGRKLPQYNYIPVLKYSCTGMTFCPCRLDQLYLCIWHNILVFHFAVLSIYTTYLSMTEPQPPKLVKILSHFYSSNDFHGHRIDYKFVLLFYLYEYMNTYSAPKSSLVIIDVGEISLNRQGKIHVNTGKFNSP